MTEQVSFKTEWVASFEKERDYYCQSATNPAHPLFDVFEEWDRNAMPESTAERQLINGLAVYYAGVDDELAGRYLGRAAAVIERVELGNKLRSEECRNRWPYNRGRLLRTKAWTWLELGRTWDSGWLQQSARCYEEWVLDERQWDSQLQAHYLTAARLSVFVGDFENVRRLFKVRRSLKWHQREADLWKCVVNREPIDVARDHKLLAELTGYFDLLRNPDFKPDVFMDLELLRFELAAIRDRYFISPDSTVNRRRVIEAVSA